MQLRNSPHTTYFLKLHTLVADNYGRVIIDTQTKTKLITSLGAKKGIRNGVEVGKKGEGGGGKGG